jgi:glycosyltransferase involved in cell wall biosynthesis
MITLEAMATETSVVASALDGLREQMRHGREALLTPPRDPDALARALLGVLRDPARGRALGAAGRARVVDAFDIRRTVEQVAAIYREVLRRRCGNA